jgi:serine/threonine protein kinase
VGRSGKHGAVNAPNPRPAGERRRDLAGSFLACASRADRRRNDPGHAAVHGPGAGVGTAPAYRPPTDVYSPGAVLYEVVTGRPPFTGATREQIRERVLREPPPPLEPAVLRDRELVCLKCLEKYPQQRYPRAVERGEDLQRLLEGHAVGAPAPGPDRSVPESDLGRMLSGCRGPATGRSIRRCPAPAA